MAPVSSRESAIVRVRGRRAGRCTTGSWCRKSHPSSPRASRDFEERACARSSRRAPPAMQRRWPDGVPAQPAGWCMREHSERRASRCTAEVLKTLVHHRRRERQRLRPPGAFGRAVRHGWFSRAGRVLTGSQEPGPRRRAFAASGAGWAQTLTLRSAAYIDDRHHPVTLRVPPHLEEEGRKSLTLSEATHTTPSRCACHPSSERRGRRRSHVSEGCSCETAPIE